jgi:hypothetical protein
MAGEAPEDDGDRLTLGMRKHALEQLPMAVQTIAAYWQSSGRALTRREPVHPHQGFGCGPQTPP